MAVVAGSAAVAALVSAPQRFENVSLQRSIKSNGGIVSASTGRYRVARVVVEARQSLTSTAGKAAVSSVGQDARRKLQQAASLVAINVVTVLPALAEEMEKGKIFDFNLTLPIMVVQFLLLMVGLDNIWFKPVAKVMDDRDEAIRSKLMGVRDNSDEISGLQKEAESILKAARVEVTAALNKMKQETAAELDAKLQESRARIEKELEAALSNLEQSKKDTLSSLDAQVQALGDEIVKKVIPFQI